MRTIAITKKCVESEKELILSAVEKEDKVLFFEDEAALLAGKELGEIEIVFGEPDADTISRLPGLRWIQMTWAGANKYTFMPDFPAKIELTSASGAYGPMISEYIISGILALYKKLYSYRLQLEDGGWYKLEGNDTLEGKRVLIVGAGDIGRETAKKIRSFGAYSVGICRTPGKVDEAFDETDTIDSLDGWLPDADVVVIALPGTAETAGLFDANRMGKMKSGAILVNVGRGFIVDTDALTEALQQGELRGAVLDVTEPEPLPEKHPLRFMGNVVLTPHISGISWGENPFTRKRILEIFVENLKRDYRAEAKRNIIDFSKGY